MSRLRHVNNIKSIFSKAVEAVEPSNLITKSVQFVNGNLIINNSKNFKLFKPCYIVGFGKAVVGMAAPLMKILGQHLQAGIITVPTGIFKSTSYRPTDSRIRFIEGAANNLPDENSLKGAQQIKDLVMKLQKDDLLIVLISGGGSALLPLPKHPVTLSEKLDVIKKLAASGVDIQELNCVRKCLSELKGGGLALLAYPANVISLILSDVVGDPLEYIASGPTTPNSDSEKAAIGVLKQYSLYHKLPDSIKNLLESKTPATIPDVVISKGEFVHVHNYIIGNNSTATRAAFNEATALGYRSFVLSTTVRGEVNKISKIYAELACKLASLINSPEGNLENLKLYLQSLKKNLNISASAINDLISTDINHMRKGVCLILAGEPTVVVKGNGKGGRNQHLALAFSIEVNKFDIKFADITFLSCGTDGIDGPTDAAGAIGNPNLVCEALRNNIDPIKFLFDNDSYNFYSKFDGGNSLIRTGHTGTNVMDIHLLLVTPKD